MVIEFHMSELENKKTKVNVGGRRGFRLLVEHTNTRFFPVLGGTPDERRTTAPHRQPLQGENRDGQGVRERIRPDKRKKPPSRL